jgi:hypothetical protein
MRNELDSRLATGRGAGRGNSDLEDPKTIAFQLASRPVAAARSGRTETGCTWRDPKKRIVQTFDRLSRQRLPDLWRPSCKVRPSVSGELTPVAMCLLA